MGISRCYYLEIEDGKKAREFYEEAYKFFNQRGLTQQSFGDPAISEFEDYPSNTFFVMNNRQFYRVNVDGGHFIEGNRIYLNVEHTDRLPSDITRFIEKFDLKEEKNIKNF